MASKRKLSYSESRPEKKSLIGLPSDLLGLVAENVGLTHPLSSFIQDEKVYTIEKKMFEKELPTLLYDSKIWITEVYYLPGFLALLKAGKYDIDIFSKLFANFIQKISLEESSYTEYMEMLNSFETILDKTNYNNWFTENVQGLANFLINVYKLTDDPNIFLILAGGTHWDMWNRFSTKNAFGRDILNFINKGVIKYDPIYRKIFDSLEDFDEEDDEEDYEVEEKKISDEFDNLSINHVLNPKWKKDDGKCIMLTEEEFSTYIGIVFSTEDHCNENKDLDKKEKKELLTLGYQQIMNGAILSSNFSLMDGILKYIAPFYDLTFRSVLRALDIKELNYLMNILKTGKKDSVAYKMVDDVRDEIMARYNEI